MPHIRFERHPRTASRIDSLWPTACAGGDRKLRGRMRLRRSFQAAAFTAILATGLAPLGSAHPVDPFDALKSSPCVGAKLARSAHVTLAVIRGRAPVSLHED